MAHFAHHTNIAPAYLDAGENVKCHTQRNNQITSTMWVVTGCKHSAVARCYKRRKQIFTERIIHKRFPVPFPVPDPWFWSLTSRLVAMIRTKRQNPAVLRLGLCLQCVFVYIYITLYVLIDLLGFSWSQHLQRKRKQTRHRSFVRERLAARE